MQKPDENDDINMTVDIELNDGTKVTCAIVTILTVNNKDYIVLLPLDENGEENAEGQVYIYRYFEDETGAPSLDNIESDEEYDAVAKKFDELYGEALDEE